MTRVCGHRKFEVVFRFLTSLLLCGVAIFLESYLLGALGIFGLIAATTIRGMSDSVQTLRAKWQSWPSSIETAEEPLLRDVFDEAVAHSKRRTVPDHTAQGYAAIMRTMFGQAKPVRISTGATLGLVALYGFAFVIGIVAIVIASLKGT